MSSGNSRRVVVTGLGLLSPIGLGVKENWSNLLAGKSGIVSLKSDEYKNLPCKIAGKINTNDLFDKLLADNVIKKSELKSLSLANIYAVASAHEAVKDSGWSAASEIEQERAGTSISIGMSGIIEIAEAAKLLSANDSRAYKSISPYFVPKILSNLSSGILSIKYKLKGPNNCLTTACAAGAHAISDGYNLIRSGAVDLMLCGATEACIHPISMAGFSRMRALATNFNETPLKSSRPFDRDRDGFVMSEGSGCLVLESLENARKRNCSKIYAEILGVASTADANHITNPSPDGNGPFRCMSLALKNANLSASQINYINAHATSTPAGDLAEINAIKQLFAKSEEKPREVFVSSIKGSLGHLLGAAGAVETIFTILACDNKTLPPSINIENLDSSFGLDESFIQIVQNEKKTLSSERLFALKNSFGFGGTNASICLTNFVN